MVTAMAVARILVLTLVLVLVLRADETVKERGECDRFYIADLQTFASLHNIGAELFNQSVNCTRDERSCLKMNMVPMEDECSFLGDPCNSGRSIGGRNTWRRQRNWETYDGRRHVRDDGGSSGSNDDDKIQCRVQLDAAAWKTSRRLRGMCSCRQQCPSRMILAASDGKCVSTRLLACACASVKANLEPGPFGGFECRAREGDFTLGQPRIPRCLFPLFVVAEDLRVKTENVFKNIAPLGCPQRSDGTCAKSAQIQEPASQPHKGRGLKKKQRGPSFT